MKWNWCKSFILILFSCITVYLNGKEIVKIGFLVPSSNVSDVLSRAAIDGAELAIQSANSQPKCKYTFELKIRYCDGLWGAASKESVNLVYEDEVCAIVGSLDGRNAHLAEQVAAKSHLVFMSTRASDPTLSQAYVPWYFRIVPNDEQQAATLIDEITKSHLLESVSIVVEDSYDAKYALKAYQKNLKKEGVLLPPVHYTIEPSAHAIQRFILYQKSRADNALLLFVNPKLGLSLATALEKAGINNDLYGQFNILGEKEIYDQTLENNNKLRVVSSEHWFTDEGNNFQKEFQKDYGYRPGPLAAYAFDGVNLLIQTIQQVGPNAEQIKKKLTTSSHFGTTGPISFDAMGNRKPPFMIMQIFNGIISEGGTK